MEPSDPVSTQPPAQPTARVPEQTDARSAEGVAARAAEQEPDRGPAPPVSEGPASVEPAVNGGPSRRRLLTFRILAAVPVVFFAVAELNLLAPWVFLLPTEDHPEPHRWFFVVSAAADLFGLVAFVGLILRPRLTGLAAWVVTSVVIVLLTIVTFQPFFLLLVAVLIVPAAIAYPYRRDLEDWRSWWSGARRPLLGLAAVAGAVLLVVAVAALGNQIDGNDTAADANWWNDYAEHSSDIALVGLFAASRAPGALLLRGVLSLVWVYLGVIAVFVLPDATGSWGVAGGLAAVAVGIAWALGWWVDRPVGWPGRWAGAVAASPGSPGSPK